MSKISGTSVTISKEESLSTEFELPSSSNQKVEWNIYQKYINYEFLLSEKNFFKLNSQNSTYIYEDLLHDFEPLQKAIPFDCKDTNFIGIPGEFKIQTELWLKGKISDEKLIEEIKSLADKKILNVEYSKTALENTPSKIPNWFKQVVAWWLDDKLEDANMIILLEHLIQKEIIVL